MYGGRSERMIEKIIIYNGKSYSILKINDFYKNTVAKCISYVQLQRCILLLKLIRPSPRNRKVPDDDDNNQFYDKFRK